jgi:hypothetical protein
MGGFFLTSYINNSNLIKEKKQELYPDVNKRIAFSFVVACAILES